MKLENKLKYNFFKTHNNKSAYNIQIEEPFTYKSICLYIPEDNYIKTFGNYKAVFRRNKLLIYKK